MTLTAFVLDDINTRLSIADPVEILDWTMSTFADVYQLTSFGPSGLVVMNMLKSKNVPIIWLDTLYHFQESIDFAMSVSSLRDPVCPMHTFKPQNANTSQEFVSRYGEKLWKIDPDAYSYLTKVEPMRRAVKKLQAKVLITGRRRSQGAERKQLEIVEQEPETGLIRINPLAFWRSDRVWEYITRRKLAYNVLYTKGYTSIGDYQ